ncbi:MULTISPECIES: hypothetical protein [unclassified Streptomyces]|uniref:hypothetical protein n=1 Tax=unclassified Streptomyces TaxID=2593676 RepID=UPI00381903AF
MIIRASRVISEVVPDSELPQGRAVFLDEGPGWIRSRIGQSHITDEMRDPLAEKYRTVLVRQQRWVQTWGGDSDFGRLERPAENLGIAEAVWKIVPARRLLPGELCSPGEDDGRLVWSLRKGHVTPQLVDEMNVYLHRMVGDGLWIQLNAGEWCMAS